MPQLKKVHRNLWLYQTKTRSGKPMTYRVTKADRDEVLSTY